MDEARAVLERLERIERLDAAGTPARVLLGEVRALLSEAEAWARREGRDADDAADAVERCRRALTEGRVPAGR